MLKTGDDRLNEMLRFLDLAAEYVDPNKDRAHINGLEHALRCAGAASSAIHPQLPFAALVHDLARPLNDVHHGEIVAEIVRDRVAPEIYYLLRWHGLYQDRLIHGGRVGILDTDIPADLWSTVNHMSHRFAGIEAASFNHRYAGTPMPYPVARCHLKQYLG